MKAKKSVHYYWQQQWQSVQYLFMEWQQKKEQDSEIYFPVHGDGMSYPQVQSTNYYLNAIADDGDEIPQQLKAS